MSVAAGVATVARRSGTGRHRRQSPALIASAAVIVGAAIVAIFGPLLAPYNPDTPQLSQYFVGPSPEHLLGFDASGRDVFSRLLYGARTSMIGPLAVTLICMTLGSLLAVTAAWRGGAYDAVIGSGLDIVFAFPGILLAVLAAAVFGAGLVAPVLALSVAYTPYVARVLRGAALRERAQPYVAALEVQGASSVAICLRHLIPNMLHLIVAQATTLFGYAMVDLAAISYLGLGVQPPAADWGVMVSENQQGIIQGYSIPALSAGLCIVVVVVAFNILGERLYERGEARR
ncbi:MAG TPA: ABC transporter permease [Candidatus Dormibacteraeota bacterium]|nr:ABC transporter permease [Candidatus Dormibacteraeota bacterium]